MTLNPDIAAYLELVEAGRDAGKSTAMHQMSPEQARTQFDESSQLMNLVPVEIEHVQPLRFQARDGHWLQGRLYARQAPGSTGQGALLYFHGGGYVVGSLDSHDNLCRTLAEQSGQVVIAVEYRLAPQWRFPTAFEDAEDAWAWLLEQRELNLDPARLAVGGDSVGGSLAAALANSLGQASVRPCLQVLLYPVTDASCWRDSHQRYASGYLLERQSLEWFYNHYQRRPEDRADPRFSPLLGALPAGLAPTWLLLAGHDPLLDEGLAYAAHLREAGAQVQLWVHEGMTHDFMRMDAVVEDVAAIQSDLGERLARALGSH
jgi:acetyl esterase